MLRLCDATGISSISEFDDRFPLTQSLFNWSQDLETALYNAGRDNREMLRALIDFCEESLRRFPREDQLTTENRRRARLLPAVGHPHDGNWAAIGVSTGPATHISAPSACR